MKTLSQITLISLLALWSVACNPQLKQPKEDNPAEPTTATPPDGYQAPNSPIPLEDLDEDCYEAVTNTESIPCPDVYAPVCGCDNRNYSNSCQSERAGIKKWTSGNCK